MRNTQDDKEKFYLTGAQKDNLLKYIYRVGIVILVVGILILGKNTLGKSVEVFGDASDILEDYQDDIELDGIEPRVTVEK